MQFLYEQTEDHAKLLHCEPFAHAIRRSVRERDESCSVVYELLSGRALKLLLASGNKPAIGPERVREREVPRIPLQRPEVDTSLVSLCDIAMGKLDDGVRTSDE